MIGVGRIMPDAAERHIADDELRLRVDGPPAARRPRDPARRSLAGRPDLVRTCINCYVCVAQNFWDGTPVCAVNAELGHYDEGPIEPADVRRTVAVVGGGPGGMEAARVAALRGHRVTLFEKGAELGGTARFSSLTTPMNAELVRYLSTCDQGPRRRGAHRHRGHPRRRAGHRGRRRRGGHRRPTRAARRARCRPAPRALRRRPAGPAHRRRPGGPEAPVARTGASSSPSAAGPG